MRGLLSVTVVPTNGHNVPQALWEMMNQRGLVYPYFPCSILLIAVSCILVQRANQVARWIAR